MARITRKQLKQDEFVETAIDRGSNGNDNTYGHGFVDAFAAVEFALSGGPDGDATGDGIVDFRDLLQVLADWGPCPPKEECPSDLNGDGVVDLKDVIIVLTTWD